MEPPRKSFAHDAIRQLAWHGLIALGIAVFFLVALRGLDVRIILFFIVPPIAAVRFTGPKHSVSTRILAWSFLVTLGIGAGIAHFPQLFPKLGGMNVQLPLWQHRMLSWYGGVYLIFMTSVAPMHAFIVNLRAHRRREPTQLSPVTCYLGLVACALLTMGLPQGLGLIGFWPIF